MIGVRRACSPEVQARLTLLDAFLARERFGPGLHAVVRVSRELSPSDKDRRVFPAILIPAAVIGFLCIVVGLVVPGVMLIGQITMVTGMIVGILGLAFRPWQASVSHVKIKVFTLDSYFFAEWYDTSKEWWLETDQGNFVDNYRKDNLECFSDWLDSSSSLDPLHSVLAADEMADLTKSALVGTSPAARIAGALKLKQKIPA